MFDLLKTDHDLPKADHKMIKAEEGKKMAKTFDTEDSHKMLYYILETPRFSQRPMARDLGWGHGEKVSSFISWLEDLKYVRRTFETRRDKPKYEVPSRAALLNFYSRHRNMADEKIESYSIGNDYNRVRKFLNDNGAIMCLTTALSFYDDNFRDPAIHVYAENKKLLDVIPKQSKGSIRVHLYDYHYADIIQKKDGFRITSPTRTIMDLFCNNLAHAAEQLMSEAWHN